MTLENWMNDFRTMVMFFTRLPMRSTDDDAFDFTRALRAAPLAGLVVGGCGAAVLLGCWQLGLSGLVSSTLTIAAMVLVTGGLHEDALADVADGFGGGDSRERKLEIMRDSSIGAYGTCAIVLVLLLKVSVLTELVQGPNGLTAAILTLLAAAAVSRGASVALLHMAPPARADGVSHRAGQPDQKQFREIVAVSAIVGGICLILGPGLTAAVVALSAAACAVWLVKRLALVQIGGHTGDVAGFCQQIVDCTVLVASLVAMKL